MPDTLDQKRVQAAVDRRLSAIEENPFLAQRIMAGEKGDTPVMKKKISVSVALILVLTMLTVGAAERTTSFLKVSSLTGFVTLLV